MNLKDVPNAGKPENSRGEIIPVLINSVITGCNLSREIAAGRVLPQELSLFNWEFIHTPEIQPYNYTTLQL